MGVALLNFVPTGMSFEDYFCLRDQPEDAQLLRFLLGLSPAMLQRGYLVDPGAGDGARRRGPSTAMASELCAGDAATQVLKLALHRGRVLAAPSGLHIDAYRQRMERTRAPSGDNTHPWRFEICNPGQVTVHGFVTRDHCVYDLQGHASQIARGALLETMRIAASGEALHMDVQRRVDLPATIPTFDITFTADASVPADPLLPYIRVRSTQRRALSNRPLTRHERAALQAAVQPHYRVVWLEQPRHKRAMARLVFANAGIRLTIPEAYAVHSKVIAWRSRYSADRIPDQAVGLAPLTTRLMEWTLQKWERVVIFNRYLAGTLLPRIQLDVMPALRCAGHFVLVAAAPPADAEDYLAAGRALQRFWLTATRLGLQLQPEMTPLIIAEYVRNDLRFTTHERGWLSAKRVSAQLTRQLGPETCARALFMGRIGAGPAPQARSVRLPLEELLIKP